MDSIKFKKLELTKKGNAFQRFIKSKHNQKTIITSLIGMIGGVIFFYVTEGKQMQTIPANDIIQHAFMGGFLGFFITNSPCARGRC